MKRLNPQTGTEFKFGDVRADGMIFYKYRQPLQLKKDGFYSEHWLSKQAFDKQTQNRNNWVLKNPSKVYNYIKNWRKNNPNSVAKISKRYRNNNPEKNALFCAKRRAENIKATPKWLTKEHLEQIEDFYIIAKMFQLYTGQQYHVDHIVPLRGKNVSGLHTPWNLQVILAKENLSKGNRYGV